MHFEQMLANQGTLFGHRLIKPESVAMMSTNKVGNLFNETGKGGSGRGFGYTVGITMNPEQAKDGRMAGAFGWGGAAGTMSWDDARRGTDGRVYGSATDRLTFENRRSDQRCY